MAKPVDLVGWGRYPRVPAVVVDGPDLEAVTADATLSRGLGRAYGDAALPARPGARVACSTGADRVLTFDRDTGVLRAQAGLSLGALHDALLREGWACPVLPGTQFVTLGGMVAADVHGKNHHVVGSIGRFVRGLRVRVADGRVLDIGPHHEPELFFATHGGMGLTGHILEVELQMERVPSSWILQEQEAAGDLEELLERLAVASDEWPMTVAWADGLAAGARLGRGILIKGRWAEPEEAPKSDWRRRPAVSMPPVFPAWLPRQPLVRTFNACYFAAKKIRSGRAVVPPLPFFHPLDVVRSWNRFYGPSGFTQYQCVLPGDDARLTCRGLFEYLAHHRAGAFLAVIKDFGKESKGTLSFPTPGLTVSLDLPIRLPETTEVVAGLNQIVDDAGGRIYLAKDSLTDAMSFRRMENRLDAFNEIRDRWDPERKLRSALSVRLLGDPP